MGKIITRKLTFTLLLILFFAIGILFCWTYSKTLPTFKYTQKLSFQYSNLSKLKPIKKINLSLNQIMELYTSTETVKQQSKPETTAPAITTKTSLQNIPHFGEQSHGNTFMRQTIILTLVDVTLTIVN